MVMPVDATVLTHQKPVVEIQHLRKTFGSKVAIEDLSFTVNQGEILGLLGPNGAGKTTAIQILLGLISPTQGTVNVFGMDVNKHRVQVLKRCNFSSAYVMLPHNLKVWENLLVFAELYGVRQPLKKIDELLELLEMQQFRNSITGKLSSGEQTRINLCKALLNDPELLLLDEPTASLDPDIADKVRKLLRRVQSERKITMIQTSHNMRDVEEVCDRLIFVSKGRLLASGTPDEIVQRFDQNNLEEVFIHISRGGDLIAEGEEEGGGQ